MCRPRQNLHLYIIASGILEWYFRYAKAESFERVGYSPEKSRTLDHQANRAQFRARPSKLYSTNIPQLDITTTFTTTLELNHGRSQIPPRQYYTPTRISLTISTQTPLPSSSQTFSPYPFAFQTPLLKQCSCCPTFQIPTINETRLQEFQTYVYALSRYTERQDFGGNGGD